MKPTQRPSVSLLPETGTFLSMPSLLINGGPLLSLLCSAWVHHCHRLLVVDWCASRLVKADLLSGHFDIMQSRESADLTLTCCPSIHLRDLPLVKNHMCGIGV